MPLPERAGNKLPSADPFLEWSAPVNPGEGAAPGQLRMDLRAPANADAASGVAGTGVAPPARRSSGEHRAPVAAAQQLATLVAQLVSEQSLLRRALAEREAELATGVPIVVQPRPTAHLATRLEAVLRGGAESLDCHAAAMYLLDDATTELKLRAQWGLGAQRLTEAGRPLVGALGDLEALSGHAVVLEDDVLMDLWRVPEPAGAAVCVPISGPSSVLGTLWLFCTAPRKFSATQTNLAEIIAGRLAVELDREALIAQMQAERRGGLTTVMLRT